MSTEFDQVFEEMNAPDYPATCDQCGVEGTNASMDEHVCGEPPVSRAGEREEWRILETITRTSVVNERGENVAVGMGRGAKQRREHAEQIVAEHNQHATLIGQRDQLVEIISMTTCYGCHNRIGWNETPTKYGDWTKCSNSRATREILATIEPETEVKSNTSGEAGR